LSKTPHLGDASGKNKKLLENATYGLAALKALVDDLETRLTAARAGYLDNLNNAGLLKANKYAWKKQPIAPLAQSGPTQNTWYTILDTTEDALLIMMSIYQTNSEAGSKDLQVRLTIDGITMTGSVSLAHNTTNLVYISWASDTLSFSGGVLLAAYYAPLPGQSVKVEARITSAPGTTQVLGGAVQYCTLEAT